MEPHARLAAPSGEVRLDVTDRDGRGTSIAARPGASLMLALRDAGLPVLGACGGMAACATCHVHLPPEWHGLTPPPSGAERDLLSFSEGYDAVASRLACQIVIGVAHEGLSLALAPDY